MDNKIGRRVDRGGYNYADDWDNRPARLFVDFESGFAIKNVALIKFNKVVE